MSDLDLKNHYTTGYLMLRGAAKEIVSEYPVSNEAMRALLDKYKALVKLAAALDTDLPNLD